MNGYGYSRGISTNPYTDRRYGPYLSATQGFLNSYMRRRQMLKQEQYQKSLMDLQKKGTEIQESKLDLAKQALKLKEGTGGLTGMAGYLHKNDPVLFEQYAKRLATGSQTLNVNIPALEKGTRSFLEKEIVEFDTAATLVGRSLETVEDDFLTYPGKLQAGAERVGEKLGLGTDTDFLARRSTWMATAQRNLLDYRHKITGVAGKPEEYADIAKAAPDPERNSPTEFRAKARELIKIGNRLSNRYKMFLYSGIKNPAAEQLTSIPYIEMPEHSITREEAVELARKYNIGSNRPLFGGQGNADVNAIDDFLELGL